MSVANNCLHLEPPETSLVEVQIQGLGKRSIDSDIVELYSFSVSAELE